MSSSKLSLCVEIELISIGVEEQRKGGKLKNALWRNEGNGSEWRNGITIKEMVRNLKKWNYAVGNGSEKWKNKEGNGTEWRDGIIMKEMVRNGSTA